MATAPPSIDPEDEALMTLLTDALRAGPASPEWSRAVATLRNHTSPNADEYQLLLSARQNLESGRRYREVRGGPAFTRSVLAGVDDISNETARRTRSTTTLLIGFGALVVIVVLVCTGVWLIKGRGRSSENLSAVYLNTVTAAATFDGPLPAGWRTIGALSLNASKGLQPMPSTKPVTTAPALGDRRHEYTGGGIVTTRGLPGDAPLAVEVVFNFGKVSDEVVPEVFVADSPHFNRERATSPHELAWLVRGGQMRIALPDGKFAGDTVKVPDHARLLVRMVVGVSTVRVVANDQLLYDGPSYLGTGERFTGVRLLRHGNAPADVRVASIQVLQP